MGNIKRIITLGTVILAVGATSITAFATTTHKTPADIIAGLTDKTAEEVVLEKEETGKSYGTIANDAGKLEEFKEEGMQMKKDMLKNAVEEGKITQEKADEITAHMEERQADCDGTRPDKIGKKEGLGFGMGDKEHMRQGEGQGKGMRNGEGQGKGMRNGEAQGQDEGINNEEGASVSE